MILDDFYYSIFFFIQDVKFFLSDIWDYINDFIKENSCLAKLFGYSTQRYNYIKVFENIDWDELYRKKVENKTTVEEPYKDNAYEIFNLIKENSIEELERMNISNI